MDDVITGFYLSMKIALFCCSNLPPMQNTLLKKVLPHVMALLFFMLVAALFCLPALQGNELDQHDNVSWKGMAQNAFEYKAEKGHFPLWNTHLFSGMPNYQVAMEGKSILPNLTQIFMLGLPKPMSFFFLACVCFYILALTLGASSAVAALVATGYAFSTYNPVIIAAGHDTQMISTAYLPLMLAGLLLTYHKRYGAGWALSTLGAYLLIGANHLQITYYFFLIALLITIAYAIEWIRHKEWKHLLLSAAISLSAALIAVGCNSVMLMTSAEYSRYTMRGGKDLSIDESGKVNLTKTSGLDISYAFEYSLLPKESFTLLLPNAYGGGHSRMFKEGSQIAKDLMEKGIDEGNAEQLSQGLPQYWGGLPYTAGPAYLGVLIVVLALWGIFFSKGPLRWGLLAATFLGLFISWGKNFAAFNLLLFEYLPLFNKFRAPSMAQVIPQLSLSAGAVLGLSALTSGQWKSSDLLSKKILAPVGALFGLLLATWLFQDYGAPIDAQILAGYTDKNGSDEFARLIVGSMEQERKAMFGSALLRALLLTLSLIGIGWAYLKNYLGKPWALGLLIVISTAELTLTSKEYLPDESYVTVDEYQQKNFATTAIDEEIKKDTDPHYRVLNLSTSTFNDAITSYHHRSVGGYHAAKLRIYQDLIEKYFAAGVNPTVLNMLNTRYLIVNDPATNQPSLINNRDSAYGSCWLVDRVIITSDRAATLEAVGKTDLRHNAVAEKASGLTTTEFESDSSASITLTRFDNDTLVYETTGSKPRFAVFSEIYYPKGWNVYVDGKRTEYVNVNYVLRGLSVGAGRHRIEFIFEPESYKRGNFLMYWSSILLLLVVAAGGWIAYRSQVKKIVKG
jgi:Bacterial membrane protein YfhO